MTKNSNKLAALLIAVMAIAPGCGSGIPTRGSAGIVSQTGSNNTATTPKYDSAPSTPNQSGYDIGLNLPRAIPTVPSQSKPGEVTLKAIANTATITPLIDAGVNVSRLRTVSISATLTWGKVTGAANYRVSRSIDNEDQTNKSKYQVRSTVAGNLGFYIDGGKVIDNLTPNRLYSYKVEALDNMGRVIAEGNSSVTPLYPINPPEQVGPAPLNPLKPEPVGPTVEFSWNKVGDADGYYVEVFSATTMLPMWGCYKNVTEKVTARYGEMGDKMIGTIPITWGLMLKPGARYAWSVAAVKSNNPDSSKATAFARANTPIRFFIAP